MARYRDSNTFQSKLVPIDFSRQITPGSFEHTICLLIDEHLDMSVFDTRYDNDEHGRPAYDPAMLLRVILSAYARGFTSSRQIEQLCRENVVFMALSGDSQPHFTTIARFVADMKDVIQPLFTEVLMVCDSQGLIGREMFAIDGCKLPSNASKEWSGTHAELTKKHKKIDRAVRRMLARHREEDAGSQVNGDTRRAKEVQRVARLKEASAKIKKHLRTSTDRRGLSGNVVQGNITDNDSAKMRTSHGTIQGYNGVAAVDDKHQVVVAAQAFGQGPENNLVAPMLSQISERLGEDYARQSKLTADSGFHSKASIAHCEATGVDAYIADGNFRKRDPRFADKARHHPKVRRSKYFAAREFSYDATSQTCHCPAGKAMWKRCETEIDGKACVTFTGYLKDCRTCPLQRQCMRRPPAKSGRQVTLSKGLPTEANAIERMKRKIDSDHGRYLYEQRLGTVEPVFGNINTNKRLNRFSHRGSTKVNAQWLMFCLVHNVEKLQRYGQLHRTGKGSGERAEYL